MRYGRFLYDKEQEIPEGNTVSVRIFDDPLNGFQMFGMFSDGQEHPLIPPPGELFSESSFTTDIEGNLILPPTGKMRLRIDPNDQKLYAIDSEGNEYEISSSGGITTAAGFHRNIQFNGGLGANGDFFQADAAVSVYNTSFVLGAEPLYRATVDGLAYSDPSYLVRSLLMGNNHTANTSYIYDSVITGENNSVSGSSLYVAGQDNKVNTFKSSAYGPAIVVGYRNVYNDAWGSYGLLLVGADNTITVDSGQGHHVQSSIIAGQYNNISGLSDGAVIGSGNTLDKQSQMAIGHNNILNRHNSYMLGGFNNVVNPMGQYENFTYNEYGIFGVATRGNQINSWNTAIFGGRNNLTDNTEYHVYPIHLFGTDGNQVHGAGWILGGSNNIVDAYGHAQMIGCNNTTFTNNGQYSVAVGLNNKTVDVSNTTCMTRMETFANGHGWIGRSPNGTRWKAVFSDAGTLDVTPA